MDSSGASRRTLTNSMHHVPAGSAKRTSVPMVFIIVLRSRFQVPP